MQVFGWTIARTKALGLPALAPPSSRGSGGWFPIVREPYTGAWQQNVEIRNDTALSYSAVFGCVTLIAADIAKLALRLVAKDSNGIWTETESPAFSPVLRKPNRYQTIQKFVEQWLTSKLIHGNTYVLKQRDERNVVVALYVLDPLRVTPLVASDGSIYYQLGQDNLSGRTELDPPIVPASEIIHDLMVALFHPLIGVTPIYACGLAALQGLNIQGNSETFFRNGANPSGMLTAPGAIGDDTVKRLQATLAAKNAGETLVGGDGLKYEQFSMNAVDAQLIEQLRWTGETVCTCYHVPPYMVGLGPVPPYGSVEPLLQAYYSQCLQSHIINFEAALDEGLELPKPYGTEFDITDLIWMDTTSRTKAAGEGIGGGALSPNEARKRYYGLGPVAGGNSPMVQQQYFSLEALAERDADAPFSKPVPATPAIQASLADDERDEATFDSVLMKTFDELHHAA